MAKEPKSLSGFARGRLSVACLLIDWRGHLNHKSHALVWLLTIQATADLNQLLSIAF